MANFTEEALDKLKKNDLINIVLDLQNKLETVNTETLEEVRKLNETFVKLESDLHITKNVNSLLEKKMISMERQCWANAQYSRRECVEVLGIPSNVSHECLEDKVISIFGSIGCDISKDGIEACHRISKKNDSVIIKFSKRKVCQSILSAKRHLRNLDTNKVDLPENTKIFVNESLCPYYRVLWAKSKRLQILGKISNFYFSNSAIKIRRNENSDPISITHCADFEKYFPNVDLSPPGK